MQEMLSRGAIKDGVRAILTDNISCGRAFENRLRFPALDLNVTYTPKNGGVIVSLEGAITERADLRKRFQSLNGAVVFDLEKVTKITSFGVREWIIALGDLWKCRYAFIRCPPPMMTQFNIVSGFAGQGELVSFYAPYHCDRCSEEHVQLIDLRRLNGAPPPDRHRCACGEPAELAELADHYFAYARARPHPNLSTDLAQLVHGELDGESKTPTIRKDVGGQVTALWIAGPLMDRVSLKRPLEDVEGLLLADLSGVTTATRDGLQQLENIAQNPDVRYLAFANVRIELLPLLFGPVISVLLRETCTSCKASVDFEINEEKSRLSSIDAACPRCGELTTVHIPPLLALAREIPVEIKEYRRSLSGAASETTPRHGRITRPPQGTPPVNLDSFIGHNEAMKRILATVHRVAPSDATVLLRGETGTGKEMLARLVHMLSPRSANAFVTVNCAALASGIIESELFGHERGAFTGASARQIGRFERANEGTLFIDEIGDMPLEVQVKVLRAIQEHNIERLGSGDSIPINIRLVAATHRPLEEMMREGSFREDLFYRLNVIPIVVPPLRERREDIWPLALYYLLQIQQRSGKTGIRFSPAAREALESHSWPGNIRELINVVARAVALTPSEEVAFIGDFAAAAPAAVTAAVTTPPPLPPPLPPGPKSAEQNLKAAVGEYERRLILEALANADGNRTRAAKELGISRQALGIKLAKYGLQ